MAKSIVIGDRDDPGKTSRQAEEERDKQIIETTVPRETALTDFFLNRVSAQT
jgi:hypothetical protein